MVLTRDWARRSALWIFASIAVVCAVPPALRSALATELPEQIGPPAGEQPTAKDGGRRLAPPELTGSGETARANALAFVEWAAASTAVQADQVRGALAKARDNQDIARALCDEVFKVQDVDHSRALVALALLGEMRSTSGQDCLAKFVAQPLPEDGTVVEGEILERTALATLQAKAIDGLAYLRSVEADRIVLEAAGQHPSRIVRAEAIAAYLWNHENSEEARQTLRQHLRSDEVIFLDRVVREAGATAETFNPKLEAYLKAHPEVIPPAPTQIEPERDDRRQLTPPNFEQRPEGRRNDQ